MSLILCEYIPRLLSTPSQCPPPPNKDLYYFSTLPRITDPRGRVSRAYQKDHHALGMWQFILSSSQEPRTLFLCLWLLLIFLHVIQKKLHQRLLRREDKRSSSTIGIRRNTSFSCVSLTSSFGKRNIPRAFFLNNFFLC